MSFGAETAVRLLDVVLKYYEYPLHEAYERGRADAESEHDEKCETCQHKRDFFDECCMSCRHFYGSHWADKDRAECEE